MNYRIKTTPTEARRYTYFSNFKNTRRVRWTELRHYLH